VNEDRPLRQYFPVIANASAFVGPDTGFLHVAGAYGTPSVGLYGPFTWDSRAKYYNGTPVEKQELCPYAPCWQHGMEIPKNKCKRAKNFREDMVNCPRIVAIEPDEVLDKLKGVMGQ